MKYWRSVASVIGAFVLSAQAFRGALYIVYRGDFQELSGAEVLQSLLVGLRFDFSMAMQLAGLPLLFLSMPFAWCRQRHWRALLHWFMYLALLAYLFALTADFLYFATVHRHVGSEVNMLAGDMPSMVNMVFSQYLQPLLGFCLLTLVGGWGWHKLYSAPPPIRGPRWARLASVPLALFAILVVARSGIDGKPLSVGEAFFSNNPAQGYLALNGAFAMSRAFMENPPPPKTLIPDEQAHAIVQKYLAGSEKAFDAAEFPIEQTLHAKPKAKPPNVVVLMLESWGAQHIDALRKLQNLPPLGLTPNFDALAAKGRLYSHFYANGQRSILGAASILSSQPTLYGMPFLGEGLEQNRLSFLGQMARSQGYETFFLQSSDRGSFRFDAISARAGFSTYMGAEDIPNLHQNPKPAGNWGTWDHNTFQAAHQLFAKAHAPFLGFVFTSSTHTPWLIPDSSYEKYHGDSPREAFWNSLFYADWALGELVSAAKKAGYFDNTIFVLVADHSDQFVDNPKDIPNLYHIPLLMVGPGVTPGIDTRIGNQFDIIPTLVELGGWSVPYAGFGRSLLDDSRQEQRGVLAVRDNVLDWIGANGWVTHDLDHSLGHAPGMTDEQVSQMEQQLFSAYQTARQLQSTNHLLRRATGGAAP